MRYLTYTSLFIVLILPNLNAQEKSPVVLENIETKITPILSIKENLQADPVLFLSFNYNKKNIDQKIKV